jgi:hypothetical protein
MLHTASRSRRSGGKTGGNGHRFPRNSVESMDARSLIKTLFHEALKKESKIA